MISRARALALLLPACVSWEDGVSVEVAFAPSPARFVTDRGYEVRLEAAWLVFDPPLLEACGLARLPALVEAAHAHGGAHAPGTVALDLLAPAQPLAAPALPDRFCRIGLPIRPATGETADLPAGLEGRSLQLEGQITDPATGETTPFTLASGASIDLALALDPALEADERGVHTIALALDPAAWFAGLDWAAQTRAERTAHVVAHLRDGIAAR